MLLKRWEPFAELRRLDREMDGLRGEMVRPFHTWHHIWRLASPVAINMLREGDNLVVRATLAGFKPDDVDISITHNSLTIKGEVKDEKEVEESKILHREYHQGSFSRTLTLPRGVDYEKAEASYEDGVLTVTIPNTEEEQHKHLKVHVKPAKAKKA